MNNISTSPCAETMYIGIVVSRHIAGIHNALAIYLQVYGASHDRDESESDIDYIERCAEQDYYDGFQNAAVFQDIFDLCQIGVGTKPYTANQRLADSQTVINKMNVHDLAEMFYVRVEGITHKGRLHRYLTRPDGNYATFTRRAGKAVCARYMRRFGYGNSAAILERVE